MGPRLRAHRSLLPSCPLRVPCKWSPSGLCPAAAFSRSPRDLPQAQGWASGRDHTRGCRSPGPPARAPAEVRRGRGSEDPTLLPRPTAAPRPPRREGAVPLGTAAWSWPGGRLRRLVFGALGGAARGAPGRHGQALGQAAATSTQVSPRQVRGGGGGPRGGGMATEGACRAELCVFRPLDVTGCNDPRQAGRWGQGRRRLCRGQEGEPCAGGPVRDEWAGPFPV